MSGRPIRKRPVHGVYRIPGESTIVFVTTCTKNRKPLLATCQIQDALLKVWFESPDWYVGNYVIMPDHVHFFAAPSDGTRDLEVWMRSRKRQAAQEVGMGGLWQSGHWDTRIRGPKTYHAKWEYVTGNPVRHGLVDEPEKWPYRGEVWELSW